MNLKVIYPISRDGLFKRGHDENVERMKQKKREFYSRKPNGGKQSQNFVCLIINRYSTDNQLSQVFQRFQIALAFRSF